MPTYEYECTQGHHFEVEQSIKAEPLKRCRVCRAKVHRLISASHFILKGGGWYADGYGNKKVGGEVRGQGQGQERKRLRRGGLVTAIASGKPLAEAIHADVRKRVSELDGGPPCLCVVLVGDDPASQSYVRGKDRAARACGIESRQIHLPATTSEAELLALVDRLNRDPGV